MEALQWLDCLVELESQGMGVVVGIDHDNGMVQVIGAVQDGGDGLAWRRDPSAATPTLMPAQSIKLVRPAKHQAVKVLSSGARGKVTSLIDDEVVLTFDDGNADVVQVFQVGVLVEQ